MGVWDDHDYGLNDGDSSNPFKVGQKQIFLDYLEEPKYSQRRLRGDQHGIYEEYQLKLSSTTSVRLILMDVRYENTGDSYFSET